MDRVDKYLKEIDRLSEELNNGKITASEVKKQNDKLIVEKLKNPPLTDKEKEKLMLHIELGILKDELLSRKSLPSEEYAG